MPFVCSICGEESARICARCTKDACNNHLCEKCLRCSDCCECEVTLSEQPPNARSVMPKHEPVGAPEPWIDEELEREEPEEPETPGLAAEAPDTDASAVDGTATEEPETKALAAETAESEALVDETLGAETLDDKPPEAHESKPPGT
jgi:hypothetical protein